VELEGSQAPKTYEGSDAAMNPSDPSVRESWRPPDVTHLKLLLNQVLWENAHPDTPLYVLEEAAGVMFDILVRYCGPTPMIHDKSACGRR
jgi:hypothetical protein